MDQDSEFYSSEEPNVFQKLGLMKSVAQKILENAANEKPVVARPAREARDLFESWMIAVSKACSEVHMHMTIRIIAFQA